MKVLIGSTAILHHLPEYERVSGQGVLEPKDIDYFTDESIAGDNFWHPDLARWNWGKVATLDELYTIKVSHAFWRLRQWEKHMLDVVQLKDAGAQFIPELYQILYPLWEQKHGKKAANLEQSPEDFFNARITRIYDHDSIHESVAYGERPLFEAILRDGHGVAVSRKKFEALSERDKHRLVREEVYATALERILIPANYRANPVMAYQECLTKTITSFSKGWFPLYIVLNYGELQTMKGNYVKRHLKNRDKLRPFKHS